MTAPADHIVSSYSPVLTPMPFDTSRCMESQAPLAWSEGLHQSRGKVAFTQGLEPMAKVQLPGYDSGVMSMLIVMFLLVTTNFRHYSTFIKTFAHDLLSVRTRANVFDERNTMRETRVLISLILMGCVCEGILVYSALSVGHVMPPVFRSIGIFSLVAVAYYLWQLVVYRIVGYVFSGKNGATHWIKGFNASQCLLALPLLIPALVTLFYPGLIGTMIPVAAILYLSARLIFVFKGFRIFYTNSFTLVYFILYLCALEIIPLIILYQIFQSNTSIP